MGCVQSAVPIVALALQLAGCLRLSFSLLGILALRLSMFCMHCFLFGLTLVVRVCCVRVRHLVLGNLL